MHKKRKRLHLTRETLRKLWTGTEVRPADATPVDADTTKKDSNTGGWWSCVAPLCAPSAVPSACELYCCTKVC